MFFFMFFTLVMDLFRFFFFQAEDGIRDGRVTGVQTCALPISCVRRRVPRRHRRLRASVLRRAVVPGRSEERRVGKECRYRWSAYHLKKKKDNVYFLFFIDAAVSEYHIPRSVVRTI